MFGAVEATNHCLHYDDVIMSTIASQITSITIVYSTIYSGADQSKHQSFASLAFVWGIHRGPVNSPHKWPVTRKMFPFDDVIMNKMKIQLWGRDAMETLSTLVGCCEGIHQSHVNSPCKGLVIQSCAVFFVFSINKLWNKEQGGNLTRTWRHYVAMCVSMCCLEWPFYRQSVVVTNGPSQYKDVLPV